MPPKHKVTREEILKAAYELLQTKGQSAVTTRAIAEKLGLSSRPIYSYFPSMDHIFTELNAEAERLLFDYFKRPYTKDQFLNMGVGYVRFSLDNPRIADFLERNWSESILLGPEAAMFRNLYESIKNNEEYRGISSEELYDVYRKISIFTFGLVKYLQATKTDMTVEAIIEMLSEAGEALFVHIFWKKAGKPRNPGST